MKISMKQQLIEFFRFSIILSVIGGISVGCSEFEGGSGVTSKAEFADGSSIPGGQDLAGSDFGSSSQDAVAAGSQENSDIDAILDKLNDDIVAIQQQIVALQSADEAINSRIDGLETDLKNFKQEMADEIQGLKEKDAELEAAIAAMELRLSATETELESLKQPIAELEEAKDALQKQIDDNRNEMLAEISRLDSAIEDINAHLTDLLANFEANNAADWNSRVSIAATILEGYAQEADTVGLAREDAGIVAAQTRLAEFDYETDPDPTLEFQGILTEITNVKIAVQDAAEAYKTAQEQLLADTQAGLQAQIDAHNDLAADVDSKFQEVNDKLAAKQLQIDAINKQMNQLTVIIQRLDDLESDTELLQNAVDAINDNFTQEVLDQIAANTNAITLNKEAIDALNASISSINATITQIQEDILGLKIGQDEVDMLAGVLQSYKDDIGAIYLEFRQDEGSHPELGARIEWITEITVKYQATSTHYQLGIAELIALFRSKEMQQASIADAITDIEKDFTSFMAVDLAQKEEIRVRMQEYTNELSQLRADLDNLQAAHEALAEDAVKREEYNKVIGELKKTDENLANDIENALKEAKDYTDKAINDFKDEVGESFDGFGEEIQRTAAALAADIADLKVKNKSLEERHEVLEDRVDNIVLTQEKKAKLAETRDRAEAAYELFLRALFDLEQQIIESWNPIQGENNWADYLIDFKIKVMEPRALNPEVCSMEFAASFPNSIQLDAQRILAMEVVNRVWKDNDPTGQLQNIAGQTTMLNRYPAGEAKDPKCLQEAIDWAVNVDLNLFHTNKDKDTSLLKAINDDPDYKKSKARFVNTIEAYARDWKEYEDILAEISNLDGDELANLLAQVAVNLQDLLATKQELETVKNDLQGQIDGMQQAIADLQAKDLDSKEELDKIQAQVNEIDDAYKEADRKLQEQIDGAPNPNIPGHVDQGMADLIAIVAEIAKRSGYADLALDADKIGKEFFADVFDEDKYSFQPKFHECQHFFSDLYNDLADGKLRDKDGKVVTATGGNWTDANMNKGDRTFCDSDSIGLGQGATQNGWNNDGTGGMCWVNFRHAPLAKHKDTAMQKVMFRCLGSAHMAVATARVGNKNKMIIPFTDADGASFEAVNKYTTAAINRYGGTSINVLSPEKTRVHGSNFAGVFDFYPTSLLTNYAGNMWIDLTPVSYSIVGEKNVGGDIRTYEYEFVEGPTITHGVFLYSPIVLDFISTDKKIQTLQHANGVNFDLDADGKAERTGWVDGLDGAFLALDLNKNGNIDDGSELFGQSTILKNGKKASHGYEALAHYDTNKDGKIDKKDPIFKELVVWFDKNVDGVSQKHEIYSLQERNVTALSVSYKELAGNSGFDKGNLVKYKSKFYGPKSCPETGCNSYDVFFGASVELGVK